MFYVSDFLVLALLSSPHYLLLAIQDIILLLSLCYQPPSSGSIQHSAFIILLSSEDSPVLHLGTSVPLIL